MLNISYFTTSFFKKKDLSENSNSAQTIMLENYQAPLINMFDSTYLANPKGRTLSDFDIISGIESKQKNNPQSTGENQLDSLGNQESDKHNYDNLQGFDCFFYNIWSNPNKRRDFVKSIIFWVVVLGGLLALLFWPSTTHHGTIEPNLNSRFWKLFSQNSTSSTYSTTAQPLLSNYSDLINQNQGFQIKNPVLQNTLIRTPFLQNSSLLGSLSLSNNFLVTDLDSLKHGLNSFGTNKFFANGSTIGDRIGDLGSGPSNTSGTGTGKTIDPCSIGPCPFNFNSAKGGSVGETANNIFITAAQVLTFVAASVAVFFIVYNGFSMMTANGDSSKYMKAWMGVLYSVLGLVVAVAAYSLIGALVGVLGNWN